MKVAQFSLDELIFSYREMGKEEDALAYLEDVAARYFNSSLGDAALRASVPVLSRLGLGEKALTRVSDLIRRFKRTTWERDLLFEKGMIYKYNLGEHEKAEQVFLDFVQSYPDDLVSEFARLELGYAPTQLGREKTGEQRVSGVNLFQSYPNPFNAETLLGFALPQATSVKLVIYDVLGQRVRTLADGEMPSGVHRVVWDSKNEAGREVSSGIYFCRLEGDGGKLLQVRKLVLLR
ncbi:MAG: hypothetical protein B1H02_02235 [Candidatus Latescibacteria bacterium 4484_107]|nr:MAG: hypothetical protein B1H02_02235 [Candidatus Latescibacteria bacterium 4484_107]